MNDLLGQEYINNRNLVKEGVSTNTLNIKISLNNIYEGGVSNNFFGKNLSALRETQGKYLSQKYAND